MLAQESYTVHCVKSIATFKTCIADWMMMYRDNPNADTAFYTRMIRECVEQIQYLEGHLRNDIAWNM